MLLILITPPKITDYTILNMYIHTVGENKTGEPKMPNSFNAAIKKSIFPILR